MISKIEKNSMHAFSIFGKHIVIVAIGTFLIHCVITIFNIYFIMEPTDAGFINDYFSHFFSYSMIPTLVTYSIFLSVVYYFYHKTKKIMRTLNIYELKKEITRAVLKTSQNTTGTIIDYISVYNAEIMEWIQQKEDNGETPPLKIVKANRKIGMALITLSKKSFLYPYMNTDNLNYDDLIINLENNLRDDIKKNENKC